MKLPKNLTIVIIILGLKFKQQSKFKVANKHIILALQALN